MVRSHSLICSPQVYEFQAAFRMEGPRCCVWGDCASLLLHFQHCALNPLQPFILSFALCERLLCPLYRYNFNTPASMAGKRDCSEDSWMLLGEQHKSSSLLVEMSRLELLCLRQGCAAQRKICSSATMSLQELVCFIMIFFLKCCCFSIPALEIVFLQAFHNYS